MPHIPLYCSTGAIIGRVNGYNFRHILRVMPPFCAGVPLEGLELMMLPAYLEHLDEMAAEFSAAGLHFPVIHADKEVGTKLSTAAAQKDSALAAEAHALWTKNCTMGQMVGAGQIVLHLWGGLDSDAHLDGNLGHLETLRRTAAEYGLEVLIENVPCTTADPITNLHAIHAAFPDQRYVFDTRFAAFHCQLNSLTDTPWLIGDRLAHIHISDLRDGAERDFSRLRPILHPGEGRIDFPALLADLLNRGFAGTVTLESPVMSEAGIDDAKLGTSLRLLRELLDRPTTQQ